MGLYNSIRIFIFPRAGNAGMFRLTCGDYTCVLSFFARKAAGAAGTRHSLRPLIPKRGFETQTSCLTGSETAKSCREGMWDCALFDILDFRPIRRIGDSSIRHSPRTSAEYAFG
jgi:hypothetical protein